MPPAARLNDPATHLLKPITPGAASANVMIGSKKAWRGLPAGLGAGIESALTTMKQLVDQPFMNPATTPTILAQVYRELASDAAKAAGKGSPAAPATTGAEYGKLMATNAKETITYVSAASVPGGQPGAIAAYTLAMKKAAADFAGAAIKAIAGMTDTHICPQPSGAIPHGPGVVTKGSKSVLINGLPACREGDKLFEAAGGSDPIARGYATVIIGDATGSGGGSPVPVDAITQAGAVVATAPESSDTQADSGGAPERKRHRVAFRVVIDRTSQPVPGVVLQITLPDGRRILSVTNTDGKIEVEDVPTPGVCGVTCSMRDARLATTYDFVGNGAAPIMPVDLYTQETAGEKSDSQTPGMAETQKPRGGVIAEIEEHRVATGETLESIASQAGMNSHQLAMFNWGTSEPTQVNRRLRDEVGCRKTGPDGRKYILDNEDDPGILFVPRQWQESGLATDQEHIIRVRKLAYGESPRRVRLFDWYGQAIAGARYAVEVGESEVARGIADGNGDIELPETKASVVTIRWSRPDSTSMAPEVIETGEEEAVFESDAEFDFVREIHVEMTEPAARGAAVGDGAARKRLSNMGYSAGRTLAENVGAFQRDTKLAITGVLASANERVHHHHDDQSKPPQGGNAGDNGKRVS